MSLFLFIFGIILFVGLVVIHELGHAIAARRNGVEVEEFGIGFPPRAWGKKLKNGILFSLNWLPLGGFVKLKGEHDSATGPGTYGGATLWAKTKILLAGVIMNWVTAAVIFTVLALVGVPKVLPNQFTVAGDTTVINNHVVAVQVGKDSPAAGAGIVTGDEIISLNNEQVTSAQQFGELTAANAGQKVWFVYKHKGEERVSQVTLNADRNNGGYIGIGPGEQTTQRSTWSAPIVGIGLTAQFTWETFLGLAKTVGQVFQAKFAEAGQSVAGPVGIFGILQSSSELGIVPVLFLIGILSLTLAVMNTLPIPGLDGGRLFVTLLFRGMGKKLTKEREETIQSYGILTLLALIILITIVDVGRFFK